MAFSLIFDPHVEKDLSKLPRELAARVFKKCQQTKDNPMRFWEKNTDRHDYHMRIGDYRVLADIDFKIKRIEVTKLGPRDSIYQK